MRVSFDDGAIDAGGEAKIVGVEDEAAHRNESSSLGVDANLRSEGLKVRNPRQRQRVSRTGVAVCRPGTPPTCI